MTALVSLSPLQQRKVSAIIGACVADAAAQPLHWIYKDEDMQNVIGDREEIEFTTPSANPFYRIANGRNTCYGDQAFVMLKSLVDSKGLDVATLIQDTYNFFGPDSEYETSQTTYPRNGPYRHGSIRDFLKNISENKTPPGSAEDDQIDCVVRIIPLVALYAGHPDMLMKVEQGLRVLQESDMAVATGLAAARILEQYILHESPGDVFQLVVEALRDPNRKCPQELDNAIIGQIRQVIKEKDTNHFQAVNKSFKKN